MYFFANNLHILISVMNVIIAIEMASVKIIPYKLNGGTIGALNPVGNDPTIFTL